MGQQRNKVIETAVDLDKLKKVEQEVEKKIATSGEEKPKEKPPKKRGRRYKSLLNLLDKTKEYSPKEAISIVKNTSNTKFDASIEAHINLNFVKDKSDQQIRTGVSLPHPISPKEDGGQKILVFSSKNTVELKKMGVDIGDEEALKEIAKGKISHHRIIADSSWMPKLAKVAKFLGPKGLMPNPKSGTVTDDPVGSIKEFAKGKLEIRTENFPIIHTQIGKAGFDETKLEENFAKLIETIRANKPANFKKDLFKSIYLSSTMGPSVKIDLSTL